MGNAASKVTASVSTMSISSSGRPSSPARSRNTTNAGTMVRHAPKLNASTKDSALANRQSRWRVLSHRHVEETASPNPSSTPIPAQPANTFGFVNSEVIRTPVSTPRRLL